MCEISNMLYEMPKKHKISIEEIADHIGCNPSSLYRQLNPHDHHPFPLKKLIPFMNVCNKDYSVLDLIESRIGRAAFNVKSGGIKIDCKAIAKLAKESGEAISTLVNAIADKKIDEEENRVCTKELLDLQKIVSSLLVKLNQTALTHEDRHDANSMR